MTHNVLRCRACSNAGRPDIIGECRCPAPQKSVSWVETCARCPGPLRCRIDRMTPAEKAALDAARDSLGHQLPPHWYNLATKLLDIAEGKLAFRDATIRELQQAAQECIPDAVPS